MHAFRRKTHTTWGVFGSVHAHEFMPICSFEVKYINETSSRVFFQPKFVKICQQIGKYIYFLAPSLNAPLKTAHLDYFLLYYRNHLGINIHHMKLYEKLEKIACKFHKKNTILSLLTFFSIKFAIHMPQIYIQ